MGHFVAETFDYDGGREVTVYVPPEPPEAVVFAGGGQVLSRWGGLLDTADVPSTMIVGVHRPADDALQLHEYSPRFDPDRFAAHEKFFVDDVHQWAVSEFARLESRLRPGEGPTHGDVSGHPAATVTRTDRPPRFI
jgi:hypothetical protein